MNNTIALLELLTEEFPPSDGLNHTISLEKPSEDVNKDIVFCITLYVNKDIIPIYFTRSELETPAHEMYNDIIKLFKENNLI